MADVSLSVRSDFPELQALHDVTKFSMSFPPPPATGVMWSTSRMTSGAFCPQYWQVNESRLKTSNLTDLDNAFLAIESPG